MLPATVAKLPALPQAGLARCLWLVMAVFIPVYTRAADQPRMLSQYIHQSWNSNHGLPQDSVNAIVQTPDGYLWLATQEGIARFDGSGFTIFDSRTTNGVVGDFVYTLFVDRRGTLWAGASSGLLRYEGYGRFTKFGENQGWPGVAAKFISEDASGTLWVGMGSDSPTPGKGLIRFRNEQPQLFSTKQGLAHNHVFESASARDGSVWIATRSGLNVLRNGSIRTYGVAQGLPHEWVRSVLVDRSGNVWAGTERGLVRFRDGRFTVFTKRDGLPHDKIFSLLQDHGGAIWVGTERGIARFDNGKFEAAAEAGALSDDRIFDIFEDRERGLWIGTHTAGLHRLREGKFMPLGKPEGLRGESVHAITEDRSGRIWIGTAPGGVTVVQGGRVAIDAVPASNSTRDTRALMQSRDGAMWIGSESGLIRFDGKGSTNFGTAEGLPALGIYTIYQDRQGTIWCSTFSGLARLDAGRFQRVELPTEAPQQVRVIYEDRTGRLWLGGGDGVGYFYRGGYTPLPGLDLNVQAVLEEPDGTLWFTSWGEGLVRYKRGRVNRFRARDGLYDDTAWSMLDDRAGNFWFGSNRGIYRVPKKQFAEFAAGRRTALEPVVFGTHDGMRKRETNLGSPAAICATDGRMWFGTTAGVVVVDPKNLRRNTAVPPVVIEQIVADEQAVSLSKADLRPGTQRIEIAYAALSLIAPERVRYRYRMEGFDAKWIDAGTRRKAFYTNIDPGRYRFQVIASNDDGVWNNQGATTELRLHHNFYETRWFVALVIAATLLGGAGLVGLYKRQRKIRHQVYHDSMTGLPNRMLLSERAEVALAQASKRNRTIAILFLDLDGFKRVNDQLGHAAGDQLLKLVATRFNATIREADTLARIGGDEFAVLVSDLGDESRASEVAERLIACVVQPFSVGGDRVQLGVSVGIALHPFDGHDIKSILQAADRAMYRAKLSGGNGYQFNAADPSETVVMGKD